MVSYTGLDTNRNEMVKGVDVIGTLGESNHIIQGFTIIQARVIEQSQNSVLDFKRAEFNKLRERIGRISCMEILEEKNSSGCLKNKVIKGKNKKCLKRPVSLHKNLI